MAMKGRMTKSVALATGLLLAFSTAALAADMPVADGDLVDGIFEADSDGPNDATQFGNVCPGGTYTREVRLAVRRTSDTAPNSFVNGTTVRWTFFGDPADTDGSQEVDSAYGHVSAEYVGSTSMTMPSGWQTQPTGTLYPPGTSDKPFIKGLVTLSVPATAPAGDPNGSASNGTVRWRANGTRTSGSDLTGADRPMGNHWTVLDGDDPLCDQAASATAAFTASHVACGIAPTLEITPNDPDAAITTEDGVTYDIDWGPGFDAFDTQVTGVKGNAVLSYAAPYTAAGVYEATVSWTDSRIGDGPTTGSTTATVTIDYDASAILQPINGDGSSIFKSSSTIPVKVRLMDCDGSTPSGLAPTIRVVRTGGATPPTGTQETPLSTSAHTDGVLRFPDGQCIYNLSGKSLPDPTATYHLIVTVPSTGQTVEADFGLKT
jgi:hypothetical protein